MAAKQAKKCGWLNSSHSWSKQTSAVSPGIFQTYCTRCGKLRNIKCGNFWNPHRWKQDRRIKNKRVEKCKRCGEKRTL